MDFKLKIAELLTALTNTEQNIIYNLIEIPPDSKMGDFSFPCFRLAKELKKAPAVIASELSDKLTNSETGLPPFLSEVKTVNAYLNFFLDKMFFVSEVLNEVFKKGVSYGSSVLGAGKTIVLDYSAPNIAKRFHIGHLYSTMIGNSLYKIFKFLGYNTIGINHLGDWGTQFGKLIVAYRLWGEKEAVEAYGVEELNRLYVKFHVEAETNPKLEDDGRFWLLQMQNGDAEAMELWKWFTEISLAEFEKTYKRLNVTFDSSRGESYYNAYMNDVVDELRQKNLLKESEGAMIVDLEDYKMPPCLILRSDGGTLYPTRDLATVLDRKRIYDFYKCIYVTDSRQMLHFSQFFKVIGLMGYEWEKDLVHLPYGLLSFEGDNLSSRKGNVPILEDLFNKAAEKVLSIINEKNPTLQNKEEAAEQVGIGALVFSALYNNRIKDVAFSWDRIFSFDGETGPYVQYTHARCAGVLEKAGNIDYSGADLSLLTDDLSFEVIKLLYRFPDKIIEAHEKYEPFIISRALIELVSAFNKFYHENAILTSGDELKKARLCLVKCVKDVICCGLGLIGVRAPEKM